MTAGRSAGGGQQLLLDPSMGTLCDIPDDAVEHGEVFTRRWVVDLILDLAGYTADRDLSAMRAVEPACGAGAFLAAMVERLSASCRRHGKSLADARDAVRAFDLLDRNVEAATDLVQKMLIAESWDAADAAAVAMEWIHGGDYLLLGQDASPADFVVGNPPYIRLEDVPPDRMAAYRKACPTMVGRSDVYVGFLEIGLRSLAPGGALAVICADRWMRNQYGRELRHLVARSFSVNAVVVMHDVDAFDENVSAYPAVTVIRRAAQGPVLVADTDETFGATAAAKLARWSRRSMAGASMNTAGVRAARIPHWFDSADSWPSGPPAMLALLEDLNDRFDPLENPATGTRVGIGVATGADGLFVTTSADVEPDRLLPLAMVRDTASGSLDWSGHYLVNPWGADGRLVDLRAYPRLRRYFETNAATLRERHVAQKMPSRWYRTIDKVDHSLTGRQKLLFPDMKMTIHPVLDDQGLYPHHNLYYVVSDIWDLRVLGGLLLSRVAEVFVDAYAVKMRGGTLRFQAQYLRRIRVPDPSGIGTEDRAALASAFEARDVRAATAAAVRVFGISSSLADWLGSPRTRRQDVASQADRGSRSHAHTGR